MISKKLETEKSTIIFEGYQSPEEMVRTIKGRKVPSYATEYAHLQGLSYPRKWWEGFQSREELEKLMMVGAQDPEKVAIARDFADKMAGERLEKSKLIKSVAGSRAHVPSVLIGRPDCRIRAVKPMIGQKVVKITIDMGIAGGVTQEQVDRIGKIIVSAIAALEADKCKVRLDVVTTTVFDKYRYKAPKTCIMCMRMNVKDIDFKLNISQFMFWCGTTAVNRGLSFNWRATHPDFRRNYAKGMGVSIGNLLYEYSDDLEYIKNNLLFGGLYLNLTQLINETRDMTDEQASEYVQKIMLED